MPAGDLVIRGRVAAGRLMVDTCTITRVTGQSVNPNTGAVTDTTTTIYTGKCRVQTSGQGAQSSPVTPGEAFIRLLSVEIQLPITVTGLQVADKITVTASVMDADLVGRVFHIRDLAHKSHATARRVQVQEAT
jgi:hypothetical protein